MKHEFKVAWRKSSPFTSYLVRAVGDGSCIPHSEILGAGGGTLVEFVAGTPSNDDKGSFAIYQSSVLLRNERGEVAVFQRHKRSHDRKRITEGKSLLLSESSALPPWEGVPRLIRDKCSFGRKDQITGIQQIGFAANVLPNVDGRPQPTYFMSVSEYRIEGNRLNGLQRDYPDTFVEWTAVSELEKLVDGYVDRAVAAHLSGRVSGAVSLYGGNCVFHPGARVVDDAKQTAPSAQGEVVGAKCVFISHAGKDWLLADLVAQFLAKQSDGTVFPTVDLHDLEPGEELWPQIEHLVKNCDCVLVLITQFTEASGGVKREIELARAAGIPVLGLIISAQPPKFLEAELSYDLTQYRKTLGEFDHVIDIIRKKPFRG